MLLQLFLLSFAGALLFELAEICFALAEDFK